MPGILLGIKSSLFFSLVLLSNARVSPFTWLQMFAERGKELPMIPPGRRGSNFEQVCCPGHYAVSMGPPIHKAALRADAIIPILQKMIPKPS